MKRSIGLKLCVMVFSVGLLSACASTDQLKQMQADIQKAQETADAALAAANAADRKAADAQAAADECAEKCDRIMQKAMSK